MNILIHPFSRPTLNGQTNAKNYAYWNELVELLKPEHQITQIATQEEPKIVDDIKRGLSFDDLKILASKYDFFIAVDSFFPHFVNAYNLPIKGMVIWTISDPDIFGYKDKFLNVLQSRNNLRKEQFNMIEEEVYDPNKSIKPEIVKDLIDKYFIAR
jgi:hypothetical protein